MRVRIDPKQLFLNGQGQVDIRKYMLITIDDDTMLDVQDEIGLDYDEIDFVLNHADISVLISHLPDTIEVEMEEQP